MRLTFDRWLTIEIIPLLHSLTYQIFTPYVWRTRYFWKPTIITFEICLAYFLLLKSASPGPDLGCIDVRTDLRLGFRVSGLGFGV